MQPATVTLERKVACLRTLCGPGDEAIETHFAWVFLVGERAWKLRKPVRRDPMDYASLGARHFGACEEVRLNRRLAPDVYLRVVPLALQSDGALAIDGTGVPVEWLVLMRRLQREQQLDSTLARGPLGERDRKAIAGLLMRFYRENRATLPGDTGYADRLRRQSRANGDVLRAAGFAEAAEVISRQLAFVDRHADELAMRVATGCFVEAHGDLRPEHVFVDGPPRIIDCLEFDRDLRLLDRAEELAFLELECARLGYADVGARIREDCLAALGDTAPPALLAFFRSHRAATRAKLRVWRSAEPDGATPGHWLAEAGDYLRLALDEVRSASG